MKKVNEIVYDKQKQNPNQNNDSGSSAGDYYTTGLTLGHSPLTGQIYLGKVSKKNPNEWVGRKENKTSEFIQVMLQKYDPNTISNIPVNGETKYRVLVVDSTKEIKVNDKVI